MSALFETAGPDAAEQVLRDAYGGNIRFGTVGQAGLRLGTTRLTPGVRFHEVDYAARFTVAAEPLGLLVLGHVRSGRITYQSDGGEHAYGPGDVFVPHQPGHPFTARWERTRLATAVISPALLSQLADTGPRRRPQPLRFTSRQPLPPQAAQTWNRTCAYASTIALATPEAAAQPLLAAATAQLLAATALAVFPNNALTDPTTEDRRDAHPATLRRAIAFIDDNAHRDITITDIAAAAFVTVRAVQLAFRRHLDATPLEYLRRVRLHHAHHDLLKADPARETVTAIAYRWGFPSASRFAASYRRAYGLTPSRTLRQD